jgi:hypothetical protein
VNKTTKTLLWVAVAAVAAYLAYRWYQNKKSTAGQQGTSASLGSNLNSEAPELIGGSQAAGTQVQPVLSVPVDVSISESSSLPPETSANPVVPSNSTTPNAVTSQTTSAGAVGPSTVAATSTPDTSTSSPTGTSASPTIAQSKANLPVLQNPTAAQVKKAYGSNRSASEQGELYVNGQWYQVPKTG